MRVGLLSTLDAPFLGYIIREFIKLNISISSIILDAKMQDPKDHRIHEERTGSRLPPLPLDRFESLTIPFYFVTSHSSGITEDLVRKLKLDLLVNAGTPRILKPTILNAPTIGIVNCHPGLLPQFRGCTCVEWAIFLDEQIGNTVHFMNEGIDEGPIVLQEGLTFNKCDQYIDVRIKVYEHGNALLAKGVKKIIPEGLTPCNLPPQGKGRYFEVVPPDKMGKVLEKLERGEYAYQG